MSDEAHQRERHFASVYQEQRVALCIQQSTDFCYVRFTHHKPGFFFVFMDRRLGIRDFSFNLKLFKWRILFIFRDLEKKTIFIL